MCFKETAALKVNQHPAHSSFKRPQFEIPCSVPLESNERMDVYF